MYSIKLVAIDSNAGELFLEGEGLPGGLDSLEVTLARHPKFNGVFPEVSSKLSFHCKTPGYNFIYGAYQERGVDASIECYIYHADCGVEPLLIYKGIINIKDVVFYASHVEVNLLAANSIDLFLNRLDAKVNLMDYPCFKQLTYDGVAARRRYVFAPYLVEYREKVILGIADGVLNTAACNYGTAQTPRVVTAADFYIGLGSTGKSIFICDGGGVPCNFNPACDNYNVHPTSANNNWSPSPGPQPQEAKIRNYPPIKWVTNDANFANEFVPCELEGSKQQYVGWLGGFPPTPQLPFEFGQGFTGWVQEFRREQYNIVPPSIRFELAECGNYVRQFRNYYSDEDEAGIMDTYKAPPIERLFEAQCDCQEVRVRVRARGKQKVYFFASQGLASSNFPNPTVEYIRTVTRANLFVIRRHNLITPPTPWADVVESVGLSPILTSGAWVAPGCNPLTLGFEHFFQNTAANCGTLSGVAYFTVGGTMSMQAFDTGYLEFDFVGCDLKRGDCVFFAIETSIAGIVDNGPIIIRSVVEFDSVEANLAFQLCDRVGTTRNWSIGIHEALARVTEHYTNNKLTVRTAYYGRENSLAGADDLAFQNQNNCSPPPPQCPEPDIIPTPKLKTFQAGAHPEAVCPVNGCGAFRVLTSGACLREIGRDIFTSMNELFDSLNAIDNIGIGYQESEPDALRVEPYEFFYKEGAVLSFKIDYLNSKFSRKILVGNYYKKIISGYSGDYVKNYVSSIDEFNTPREYNIQISSVSNALYRRCQYIASGYTIEYCRRQRYTTVTDFDEKVFIICVGASVNPTAPANMWVVEQGITTPFYCGTEPIPFFRQPSGIVSPETVYNWRIRPQYNAARNFSFLLPSMHFLQYKSLNFSYGEVNYTISGSEPGPPAPCNIGFNFTTSTPLPTCENLDISLDWLSNPQATKQSIINEEVEFVYPLSAAEFALLRAYPYNQVEVNGELFYLKKITYKPNGVSKINLIKSA